VHVGHVLGIYQTWEDCYAQVNCYLGNLHKKYNIEAEALRAYYSHPAYLANHVQPAYYGPMNANHGHPPALEIEEKPPAGDMKIRRIAPWSWKDVMLLFMAMVNAFLIWKLM
jgi:hypothetical protein